MFPGEFAIRIFAHMRLKVFLGHVSGNIMASTYAVAEKGADLVKANDSRFK